MTDRDHGHLAPRETMEPRPNYGHIYHEFEPNHYEGRYYNANGYACAVVASVGAEGAWAAYIGGASPESEEEGLKWVAARGAKLSERDARHFFPKINLPYRD